MLIYTLFRRDLSDSEKFQEKFLYQPGTGRSIFQPSEMHCGRKRGFMLKKGILFQGLPGTEGGDYQDITYLFLYGISRNVLCRAKIRDMKREWREYLLEKADRSTYQSPAFWKMLKKEEKKCARIVLGLVEDLRNCDDGRAEKAWVCLRYLVRSGYRAEEEYLREKKEIPFSGLWELTGEGTGDLLLRSSRVCMCLIMAEEDHREIRTDRGLFLFEDSIKKTEDLWNNEKQTEHSESFGERKKELLYIFMPFNFWMNKVSAVGAGSGRKERKVLT